MKKQAKTRRNCVEIPFSDGADMKPFYIVYQDFLRVKVADLDGVFFCRDENSDEVILLVAHGDFTLQVTFTEPELDYFTSGLADVCGYDSDEVRWAKTVYVYNGIRPVGTVAAGCDLTFDFHRRGIEFNAHMTISKRDTGALLEWMAPRANWKLTG